MGDLGCASGTRVPCSMDVTLFQSSRLGIFRCCKTVITRKAWKRYLFQKQAHRENIAKETT